MGFGYPGWGSPPQSTGREPTGNALSAADHCNPQPSAFTQTHLACAYCSTEDRVAIKSLSEDAVSRWFFRHQYCEQAAAHNKRWPDSPKTSQDFINEGLEKLRSSLRALKTKGPTP